MKNFAAVDIAFIALILIFVLRCSLRGFISELLSMASVVLGLFAALYFHQKGGVLIRERFMPDMQIIPEVIAFILLFLIVFILIKILEAIMKEIIEGIRLGKVDRILGVIFGFIEGIIVVCLALFVISIQPLFDSKPILENSLFARIFMPFIDGSGTALARDITAIAPSALKGFPCLKT